MDVARARRAASERALDAARVKLASTSRDIRRRALRALVVANVTGACDASLTARDSEVLRALVSMYDDAEERFDELGGLQGVGKHTWYALRNLACVTQKVPKEDWHKYKYAGRGGLTLLKLGESAR